MEILEVTDDTIAEEAGKHKIFVVDCYAEWCEPCKTMAKVIEKLAKKYGDEVTFGKLDIETNKKSSEKYGITTVPTLLLFNEGKFSDVVLGAVPIDYIEEMIEDMRERGKKG